MAHMHQAMHTGIARAVPLFAEANDAQFPSTKVDSSCVFFALAAQLSSNKTLRPASTRRTRNESRRAKTPTGRKDAQKTASLETPSNGTNKHKSKHSQKSKSKHKWNIVLKKNHCVNLRKSVFSLCSNVHVYFVLLWRKVCFINSVDKKEDK